MLQQLPPPALVTLTILACTYGLFWLAIVGVVTVDRLKRAWNRI